MRLYVVTMTGDTNLALNAMSGLGRATDQVLAIEQAVDDAWSAIKLQMQSKPVPFYQSIFSRRSTTSRMNVTSTTASIRRISSSSS